ncbi:Chain length determinant protein [Pseudomonas fluorescens]|uniref:Chain length determinant protein n=2 Tax=Pseudomonas fluorescens TaxID=294 RepID=A0A5E6VM58_PSEFL|nr:Chain length determinant protein [Pseudomonas fluorescens]
MIALWQQRLLILGAMIAVMVVGAAFAFLSSPIYAAKVVVVPPTQNDIANYNYGRTAENHLAPFSVKDVYGVFMRNLQADSLRREFFNTVYLPALSEEERSKSIENLYEDYSKALTVSPAAKDNPDRYLVAAKDGSAEQAAMLIGKFIARASELAKNEMVKNISSEADVLARNLQQQIILFREVGQRERQDSVAKLQEALVVAEAIGLERPPIVTGDAAVKFAGSLDEQPLYMRGSIALRAEINNLDTRKSDDPFINKLRTLQTKSRFYTELESNIRNVQVFRMDGEIILPENPVYPKKTIIIVLAAVLGLIIGMVIAFLRIFLRKNHSVGMSELTR